MENKRLFEEWFSLYKIFIENNKFSNKVLSIPTFPAIANNNKIYDIDLDMGIKLSWNCCNSYKLNLNGGGLISEIPSKPMETLSFDYNEFIPQSIINSDYKINPLGWNPINPIDKELDYGECFQYNNKKIYVRSSEPFKFIKKQNCVELKHNENKPTFRVGYLEFNVKNRFSFATRNLYETDMGILFNNKNVTYVFDHEKEMFFKIPLYDFKYYILYPFRFFKFHAYDKKCFKANVFVLDSENPIGIVSRYGIGIEISPGELRIKTDKPFYIVNAGPILSFRSLIETLVDFPYGYEIMNHVRSGSSAIILSGIYDEFIEFEIFNATNNDSIIEMIPKIKTDKIEICSHLGCYDIIESKGIYRIPAPSGCYCNARLHIIKESTIKNKLLRLKD
ncbi:hypothetical protein Calag_1383 [Caldisphaera lagunensis DSM 15908]|uniref:Uncharacterized protein n=1 Tax=Caldisphaera lagunensis (strain DSM 15908 / JCM 11604 / ANMR 0165 / IC-154) TaxID=1056495 RepID=L0ADA4_CALLD|nr:hypothetical protein [Caldisphaera lagunensis]AFZ71092.1 hypothetical protein Calag_1383 [Caldisphaera lagunensis DSM 15908]